MEDLRSLCLTPLDLARIDIADTDHEAPVSSAPHDATKGMIQGVVPHRDAI